MHINNNGIIILDGLECSILDVVHQLFLSAINTDVEYAYIYIIYQCFIDYMKQSRTRFSAHYSTYRQMNSASFVSIEWAEIKGPSCNWYA